jgi:hypothetical protein
MLEFLPKEVREGLEAARKKDLKRKSRLRVQVGDAVFPVLRFWHDGFALDADLSARQAARAWSMSMTGRAMCFSA